MKAFLGNEFTMSEAGVALKVTVGLRFLLSHSSYAMKNCILPTGLLETVG